MENFKLTKPIRLVELFAGIGSQAKALKNIGADFENYKVVEFDKYAIKSYNAIHGTNFEPLDITQMHADDLEITDTEKYDYILTYSFPCQSLSVAGKQEGMAKGSGTRSGLLWEVERLLDECKELPQVLLMENVPQVHGKKNIEHFNKWIEFLESKGYSNYWQDLNAKDFGIPQNRNRCFMVSILGDYKYEFPKPVELDLRLKDMLEDEVDEKYYLDGSKIKKLSCLNENDQVDFSQSKREGKPRIYKDISCTLNARDYKDPRCVVVGESNIGNNESNNRIYSVDGISPTLNTMQGGHRQPKILDDTQGFDGVREYTEYAPTLRASRSGLKVVEGMIQTLKTSYDDVGVVCIENFKSHKPAITIDLDENVHVNEENAEIIREGWHRNAKEVLSVDGICRTLSTQSNNLATKIKEKPSLRIRKLTPKECWRLMGFTDEDFEKAKKVNSNSQLYKQAGNSIVVNVLEAIFKKMM